MADHPDDPAAAFDALFDGSSFSELIREAFPPVSREAWEARVREDLAGRSYERTLGWRTPDGFDAHAFYGRDELETLLHDPGQVARALGAARRAGAPWGIRQDFQIGPTADDPALLRAALNGGISDVGLVFGIADDPPEPPHHRADFTALLDEIDVTRFALHLDASLATPALAAGLLRYLGERGIDAGAVRGSLGWDPLGAWAAGRPVDLDRAYDLTAGLLLECHGALPGFRALTVGGARLHEAGATAAQELAGLLAAASDLVAALSERGVHPADAFHHLQLTVGVGPSFFLEIAKLRALRLLWGHLCAGYGVSDAPPACVQATTAGWNQTRYEPTVNLLRGATEAAAAVLGGCDVLTVRPMSDRTSRPDAFADRLARNTQLILFHEAHLGRLVDPAAGSYYVEHLTDALARESWRLFQDIEGAGGFRAAVEEGMLQARIRSARDQLLEDVAHRRGILVGTNDYPRPDERPDAGGPPVNRPAPPEPRGARPERLLTVDVRAPLASLRDAARDVDDLAAVAFLFEGGRAPVDPVAPFYAAEPIERIRRRTELARQEGRRVPELFLLTTGDPVSRTARAAFAASFFGCAGFTIVDEGAHESVPEAVAAAERRGCEVIVLCSSDDAYASVVPEARSAAEALAYAPLLVVAGNPGVEEQSLRASGADFFVHRGTPLVDTLEAFQGRLGLSES